MKYRLDDRTVDGELNRERIIAIELKKLERRREAERAIEGTLPNPRRRRAGGARRPDERDRRRVWD